MKKVVILLLTVLIGLFVVDRIGGEVCEKIHLNSNGLTASKYRELFTSDNSKCDYQMILLGTSRCEAHYVSSIISDSLGTTVYNGGIDASDNIYSHYAALCLTLKNCKPRYIGLELRECDFAATSDDPFTTLTYLAPYIGENEEVDDLFRRAGTYWRYQISHLYRYNSKIMEDLAGYAVSYSKLMDHGYLKKDKPSVAPDKRDTMPSTFEIDTLKIHYLDLFAKRCKEKGVTLFCMISPNYDIATSTTFKYLHEWAEKNDIMLFDYHTAGLFSDSPDLFYDNHHLWHDGAVRYSEIFVHDLKEIIQKEHK